MCSMAAAPKRNRTSIVSRTERSPSLQASRWVSSAVPLTRSTKRSPPFKRLTNSRKKASPPSLSSGWPPKTTTSTKSATSHGSTRASFSNSRFPNQRTTPFLSAASSWARKSTTSSSVLSHSSDQPLAIFSTRPTFQLPPTAAPSPAFSPIFADHGLILLDPLDERLHKIAAPLLQDALTHRDELNALLLQRGKDLERAGYEVQVKVTSQSTILFSMEEG